jgi:DMSO reductase family type II enzyme chaperone
MEERCMERTKKQEEAIRRGLARSRIYCLLSPLFLYPERETFSGLNWKEVKEAMTVLADSSDLSEVFESLWDSFKEAPDLQSEYVRVFGHTLGQECPPYETQYGGNKGEPVQIFQQTQELGDIAGFYRAFGLEVSDHTKERLDHISIELEFMAYLVYKEAYALASDGVERADICREAQRKFLNDHLGRWVPLFTRSLEAKAQEGFYQRLAQLTERFLVLETEAFGLKPLRAEGLTPVPLEVEGGCFSCGMRDDCFPGEGSS